MDDGAEEEDWEENGSFMFARFILGTKGYNTWLAVVWRERIRRHARRETKVALQLRWVEGALRF